MKGFVAVTDNEWFRFLAQKPDIDEVNFWQPSGRSIFRALSPGEPFLFKLHAPYNFIVGGGMFVYSTVLPVSLAWEAFGEKNGADSYQAMRQLIEKRRGSAPVDYNIGCIILSGPFFFSKDAWVPVPHDFSPTIVRGKTYDLTKGPGRNLWEQVIKRVVPSSQLQRGVPGDEGRYGEPTLVRPRLGQGSFRVIVTDAYQRECAITQEKVLPALEAAHIKPFSQGGQHSIRNGILLRSDIHRLLDSGYVTISRDLHFEVSRRIREDFNNGEYYLGFHGKSIHLPTEQKYYPDPQLLDWHNENVFKG